MPLDTADTFTDTDDDTTSPGASYPPAPPLAPLSFLLGYTEPARTRYTTQNQSATARLLSLSLTPAESAALTYYDGLFYTYESYGDVLGSGAGALLGLALQSRKPGRIPTALARAFRASPRVVAVALRIAVFGSLGRLYGMSSAGVQALNRMRGEQRADPVMARVVAARARRLDDLTREVRMRVEGRHQDEQGLGGGEASEQGRAADDAFPDGRPSELAAQPAVERQTDDPFLLTDERGPQQQQQQQQGGWKNSHSGTGESAWERLRKGQPPPPPPEDEPQSQLQSPWPRRPPMKGFGSPEPKTDSFSFSGTAEARAQAQKEFDEGLERERRSGGEGEGEGYSEGGQGRGRW